MPARSFTSSRKSTLPSEVKKEHRLVALEVALNVNELHIQAVLGDLLLAYLERFLFALLVNLGNAKIIARRDSDDRAQRLHDRIVLDLVIAAEAVGYLKTLAGFDNDLLAGFYGLSVRRKNNSSFPDF